MVKVPKLQYNISKTNVILTYFFPVFHAFSAKNADSFRFRWEKDMRITCCNVIPAHYRLQ